jgi:hypothetical protein
VFLDLLGLGVIWVGWGADGWMQSRVIALVHLEVLRFYRVYQKWCGGSQRRRSAFDITSPRTERFIHSNLDMCLQIKLYTGFFFYIWTVITIQA